MRIAVYAKAGSIPQNRWVRLTGIVNKVGAYECEDVGATRRAHALILDHPKGGITPAVHGYADTLGRLSSADAAVAIPADAELCSNADGTVSPAGKGDFTVGVAIASSAKGTKVRIMMRWGNHR